MSSGSPRRVFDGGSGCFISRQATEHLVANPTTERTDRFGPRVAGEQSFGHVVAPTPLAVKLGDGDSVEGQVELAVAAPIETMTNGHGFGASFSVGEHRPQDHVSQVTL